MTFVVLLADMTLADGRMIDGPGSRQSRDSVITIAVATASTDPLIINALFDTSPARPR